MYWSSSAYVLGLFLSLSTLDVKVEEKAVLSKPSTFLWVGEAICRILSDWLRCSEAADLLLFMGRLISISLYRK